MVSTGSMRFSGSLTPLIGELSEEAAMTLVDHIYYNVSGDDGTFNDTFNGTFNN